MTAPVRPGRGRALQAHGLPPDAIMPLSLDRLRARSPVELPPGPAATVMLRMAYAAGDPDLLRDIVIAPGAVAAATTALDQGGTVLCDVGMVAAGVAALVARCGSRLLCAQETPGHGMGLERGESIALASATPAPSALRPGDDAGISAQTQAAIGTSRRTARNAAISPETQAATATSTRTARTAGTSPQTQAAVAASTRTARGLLALVDAWRDAVIVIGNAPTALLALLDALADGAPRPAAVIATPCGLVAATEAKQLLIDTGPVPYITVRGARGGSAVAAAACNACAHIAAGTPA